MFSVIVFLQINIKKNTNSSLKRPQDKSTKTGSVKKEKVVKKEEGNYLIIFLAVIILYTNKLKTFSFEVYCECTSQVLEAVSSSGLSAWLVRHMQWAKDIH